MNKTGNTLTAFSYYSCNNSKLYIRSRATMCIKIANALQCYFIGSATAIDYTSDLEKICGQKVRSILDLYTIQAPLLNPLGVFSKTPTTRCRSEI